MMFLKFRLLKGNVVERTVEGEQDILDLVCEALRAGVIVGVEWIKLRDKTEGGLVQNIIPVIGCEICGGNYGSIPHKPDCYYANQIQS